MTERGGSFQLVFSDGSAKNDIGWIDIDPSLNFKAFQSAVSQKIGISPNHLTIYYERGFANPRTLVTNKFDFGRILGDRNCFFMAVLKQTRPARRRKKTNSRTYAAFDNYYLDPDESQQEATEEERVLMSPNLNSNTTELRIEDINDPTYAAFDNYYRDHDKSQREVVEKKERERLLMSPNLNSNIESRIGDINNFAYAAFDNYYRDHNKSQQEVVEKKERERLLMSPYLNSNTESRIGDINDSTYAVFDNYYRDHNKTQQEVVEKNERERLLMYPNLNSSTDLRFGGINDHTYAAFDNHYLDHSKSQQEMVGGDINVRTYPNAAFDKYWVEYRRQQEERERLLIMSWELLSRRGDDGASSTGAAPVCEVCKRAEIEGQTPPFHPCKFDPILATPFRSTLGPIARPVRTKIEVTNHAPNN